MEPNELKITLKRKRSLHIYSLNLVILIISKLIISKIVSKLVFCDIYSNLCLKTEQKKEGEIDPKFWEILLSADKKDYERICAEYGVTDFRWMLKKLNEIKREREEQQAEVFLETF